MKLPSKELLSEVLGLKTNLVEIDEARNNVFYYCNKFGRITGEINIYELAHKCKEWALSKNYEIESSLFVDGNKKRIGYSQVLRKESPMLQKTADTEPKATFKACEWIMEQTKCGS